MPPHLRAADDARMDPGPKLYSIRIKGHLGATSLAAFPAMVAEHIGKDTVLTGVLPDCSALFGVLAEVEALGLELIELDRLIPRPDHQKGGGCQR
jgi:hypothetical protein